jgi:hypothetical protein
MSKKKRAGHWWLTSVILTTWETEIRRSTLGQKKEKKKSKIPASKITRVKWT